MVCAAGGERARRRGDLATAMPTESPTPTDCPPDTAFVELLEGSLDADAAARLRRHVARCDACDGLLDALTRPGPGAVSPAAWTTVDVDGQIARGMLNGDAPGSAAYRAGTILDRKYALLRLLGEGGMGSVLEAEHLGTGRRVAVKIIHGRLVASGGAARRRFRREARAAAAIDSPHIVAVLDAGEDETAGDLYLVMEYLRGEDLERLIARTGPLSPDAALRIAGQALEGLAKAHAAGIVHRDVKPANLFLARGEGGEVTVKLLDFGIAKLAGAPRTTQSAGLTSTGALIGSPLYMSPEQVQSSKDVDHRTDLWSVGCVLYAALAGRAPFRHVESLGKLIVTICSTPAPAVRELSPWVSPEVAEVTHRALAIDVEQRYPSATAALEALRALVPGGFALREEMLAGVSPEARAAVASTALPPAAPRRADARDTTASGDVVVPARGGSGRSLSLAIAGAVGLLGAVAAARTLSSSGATPSLVSAVPTVATVSRVPAPTTPSTVAAEGVQADPAPRVLLRVVPGDASVYVDGVRAVAREGAVEIVGALGSGHRVRISRGTAELSTDVFVTEKGAVPPTVGLPAPTARTLSTRPHPAPTTTAAAVPPRPEPLPVDPMREHE